MGDTVSTQKVFEGRGFVLIGSRGFLCVCAGFSCVGLCRGSFLVGGLLFGSEHVLAHTHVTF